MKARRMYPIRLVGHVVRKYEHPDPSEGMRDLRFQSSKRMRKRAEWITSGVFFRWPWEMERQYRRFARRMVLDAKRNPEVRQEIAMAAHEMSRLIDSEIIAEFLQTRGADPTRGGQEGS